MRPRGVLSVMLGAFALVSCERAKPIPPDSVTPSATPDPDAQWISELGPLFAVPGDSANTAIVLVPSAPTEPMTAALFRTAGDATSSTRLSLGESATLVCEDSHVARLSAAASPDWTIALAPTVTPLRVDSIESMPSADSAALAADIARLASGVPGDDRRFRGLPFAVLAAYRLQIERSTIVVGRAARRIPQEATPLEERTLVVGERTGSEQFAIRHSRRSAGIEDNVEHYALLAAIRAGEKHFLIIESELAGGTRYEILERSSAGEWRLRWSRQLTC